MESSLSPLMYIAKRLLEPVVILPPLMFTTTLAFPRTPIALSEEAAFTAPPLISTKTFSALV